MERRETETGENEDPERALRSDADDLEERIDSLGEHVDESREKLRARQEDADVDELAGDWEDTDDDAGGEDPSAFDDPESDDDDDDQV